MSVMSSFVYMICKCTVNVENNVCSAEKRRPPGRDRECYQRGFKACQEVVIEFLVDIEGCSFDDSFCARLVQKMQARACKLPEDLST